MNSPLLIKGGIAVDDRGMVSFVNDFSFSNVQRFYVVENHSKGFIRAWHGHKNEAKYVFVVKGKALIGTVKIDDWENPSNTTVPEKYVLSEVNPSILFIPKGYANGNMSLSKDAKIIFFSTSTLKDSAGDDYRFDARHWDIWDIEER